MKQGIYVASRASVPERVAMWRDLRDGGRNVPITSSWIDETEKYYSAEQMSDWIGQLWQKIVQEVSESKFLFLYAEPEDLPLKGAYIEVGVALACGIPVYAILPGVELDQVTFRPIGSWLKHPLVKIVPTIEAALAETPY